METIKSEQFHTVVPDTNPKEKVVVGVSIALVVIAAVGVYFYIKNVPGQPKAIHITQAQVQAYNDQVANETAPVVTQKQVTAYNAQVSSEPEPTVTQAQIDAFAQQIANSPSVVVDSK